MYAAFFTASARHASCKHRRLAILATPRSRKREHAKNDFPASFPSFCDQDRKRRGCLAVQALWRGHRERRRWRPIFRLRVRHGRRSCLRPCFSSWSKLTRVHKRVRRRFDELQGRWTRSCFEAWAGWTAHQAAEKLRKLERAGKTLRSIAAYRSFRSWQVYTRGARRARTLFARAVGGATLGAWIRYTAESKKNRQRGDHAVTVQRHVRGYLVGSWCTSELCVHHHIVNIEGRVHKRSCSAGASGPSMFVELTWS